jgi:hypothetical protein
VVAAGNGGDRVMPEDNVAAQAASVQQYDWRPRPDPTVLTTQQLRETEAAINRAWHEGLAGLRELLEQRLDGMDRATVLLAERIDKIIPDSLHGRDVLRVESAAGLQNLRELIEARISAIDRATQLLATDVSKTPTDIEREITNLRELLGSRIDGMDKANELLAANVSKFPSDVDRAVTSLKGLLLGEIQRVQDVLTGEIGRIGDVTQEKFTAIDGTFQSNALALTAALAAQKEAAAEQNKSNTLAITKSESSTKETIGANAAQAQTANASLAAQVTDIKERVVRIESTGAGARSVTGDPYDAAVLRQAESASRQAGQRAIISQVVAAVAVLASVISIIVVILKK